MLGRINASGQGTSKVVSATTCVGLGWLSQSAEEKCLLLMLMLTTLRMRAFMNEWQLVSSHPMFSTTMVGLEQQLSKGRGCPGMKVVEGKKGMEEGCQVAEWCPPRDEQGVDGTGMRAAGVLDT